MITYSCLYYHQNVLVLVYSLFSYLLELSMLDLCQKVASVILALFEKLLMIGSILRRISVTSFTQIFAIALARSSFNVDLLSLKVDNDLVVCFKFYQREARRKIVCLSSTNQRTKQICAFLVFITPSFKKFEYRLEKAYCPLIDRFYNDRANIGSVRSGSSVNRKVKK